MADPLPSLNALLPPGIKLVAYLPGKAGSPATFFEVLPNDSNGGDNGSGEGDCICEVQEGINFVLLFENGLV